MPSLGVQGDGVDFHLSVIFISIDLYTYGLYARPHIEAVPVVAIDNTHIFRDHNWERLAVLPHKSFEVFGLLF
jgi:hypothetical protein